jgi:hypothetical protein
MEPKQTQPNPQIVQEAAQPPVGAAEHDDVVNAEIVDEHGNAEPPTPPPSTGEAGGAGDDDVVDAEILGDDGEPLDMSDPDVVAKLDAENKAVDERWEDLQRQHALEDRHNQIALDREKAARGSNWHRVLKVIGIDKQ